MKTEDCKVGMRVVRTAVKPGLVSLLPAGTTATIVEVGDGYPPYLEALVKARLDVEVLGVSETPFISVAEWEPEQPTSMVRREVRQRMQSREAFLRQIAPFK